MEDKNQNKRIGFAGCRNITRDAIQNLIDHGYRIHQLVTVSPEDAESKYHISGYHDLRSFAADQGIPVYHVNDYALQADEADRTAIRRMALDLLIVQGWQRIIPAWFLEMLTIGAIGAHGSSRPLPYGRGHSVYNWSLIEGRKQFITNIFFYEARVDRGPIIGSCKFDITPWDTCETLHFKNQITMGRLLVRHLPAILSGNVSAVPQALEGATYYPPRTPENGLIQWNSRCRDIYNFCRALTKPYPGAFTFLIGQKIHIWRGQLFDTKITWNKKPGTIVKVFYNGQFIVQTRDFGFLVQEYDGIQMTTEHVNHILGT